MPAMLEEELGVTLYEEITETLLERLRAHTIDTALIATAVDDPELAAQHLFDEPFWLAHPRSHPLYLNAVPGLPTWD